LALSVNYGSDGYHPALDAIDDPIAENEPLAQRRIFEFRNNSTSERKAAQNSRCTNDFADDSGCVCGRVASYV
jgi:hypothetical protein